MTCNRRMAPYEPFDDGVETRGETILVVEEALSRFSEAYQQRARGALAEYGIEDPKPDEWYPQEAELNAFETIAEELEPHILDRLGGQIPEMAEWPDDIDGVEAALRSIDEAYRLNHRGGDIGYYAFEPAGDRTARIECKNPYPCEFDRGLIRAVAQAHSPVESFVFVEEPGETCRRHGDDVCRYIVHW